MQEDEDVDLSLVSGKMRSLRVAEELDGGVEGDEAQSRLVLYTAGDYFADRSWKGLDDTCHVGDECCRDTAMREGLKGVASEYASEAPSTKPP